MISNVEILLFLILFVLLILLLLNKKTTDKDDLLINLAVLDHVIDDYVAIVYSGKINTLKSTHNLNSDSKINSIQSYENKVNILIAETTVDIMKLLTRNTKKQLRKNFSDKSIALYITNKVRNNT